MTRPRPVSPMRIFVPTELEKMPVRDAINRPVYLLLATVCNQTQCVCRHTVARAHRPRRIDGEHAKTAKRRGTARAACTRDEAMMRKHVMRMCRTVFCVSSFAACAASPSAQASAAPSALSALSVVATQPTGGIASAEQAAEVRVRFSEAMVPLGRISDTVDAPFFSIRPAIAGVFRWAGPTLLIFTPDPKTPLPRATRYEVTIASGAAAVSGRTLPRPYTFSFTTPTVRLLSTDWYRISGRFDRPAIVALRFNQPVRPPDVLAHVTVRYQRHEWAAPMLTAEERGRMGAGEAARFD